MLKEKIRRKYIIAVVFMVILIVSIIVGIVVTKNKSYANTENINEKKTQLDVPLTKQNESKQINLEDIVENNEKEITTQRIEKIETDVEFNTQYRENNSLAKGKIQIIQEGQDGKQNAVVKSIYKNNELISSTQISSEVTKVAIDKIVEVGTAAYSNNYVPIVGDTLESTPITLAIYVSPDSNSEKLITIKKGEKVILKARQDDWYYIQYSSYLGWAQKDNLAYVDPNGNSDGDENNVQYTKEQLTQGVGFSMLLNKKSGLTLDQFKKILSNDTNDKNKVFEDNAQYFFYAEQQYNINGLFVAAVAIHESGWGTSSISLNKKNLFGYRAYDRDPSGSASSFSSYAEGIDLVSRVFVKYYVNPKGTPIYGGETAVATYYKGSTLTAVNKSYASDKNWANCVYKWMLYLYNKL